MSHSFLICAIGDSRTVGAGSSSGYDPVTLLGGFLQNRFPKHRFSVNNQAVNGSTSLYWYGQPDFFAAMESFRQSALAMPEGTKTYVQMMFGVNDASAHNRIPLATYLACLQELSKKIYAAQIPGFNAVVLHSSYYAVPGGYREDYDDACLALVQEYNAHLGSIADGTNVILGDQKAYAYFEKQPNLMYDQLHASNQGNASLAMLWQEAYEPLIHADVNT